MRIVKQLTIICALIIILSCTSSDSESKSKEAPTAKVKAEAENEPKSKEGPTAKAIAEDEKESKSKEAPTAKAIAEAEKESKSEEAPTAKAKAETEKESKSDTSNSGTILFIIVFILFSIFGYPLYILTKYLTNLNKLSIKKLESEKLIAIPEDFYDLNNDLKNEIQQYNKKVLDVLNTFNMKISEIQERLDLYSDHIDQKEKELIKYRNGIWDGNLKNSVQSLINAFEQSQLLFNLAKKSNNEFSNLTDIEAIYKLLQETLENGGIKTHFPQINDDYIKDEYVDESPFIINTDNQKLDDKIAEIIQPAYVIVISNKIIRKAKVKIYKNLK